MAVPRPFPKKVKKESSEQALTAPQVESSSQQQQQQKKNPTEPLTFHVWQACISHMGSNASSPRATAAGSQHVRVTLDPERLCSR